MDPPSRAGRRLFNDSQVSLLSQNLEPGENAAQKPQGKRRIDMDNLRPKHDTWHYDRSITGKGVLRVRRVQAPLFRRPHDRDRVKIPAQLRNRVNPDAADKEQTEDRRRKLLASLSHQLQYDNSKSHQAQHSAHIANSELMDIEQTLNALANTKAKLQEQATTNTNNKSLDALLDSLDTPETVNSTHAHDGHQVKHKRHHRHPPLPGQQASQRVPSNNRQPAAPPQHPVKFIKSHNNPNHTRAQQPPRQPREAACTPPPNPKLMGTAGSSPVPLLPLAQLHSHNSPLKYAVNVDDLSVVSDSTLATQAQQHEGQSLLKKLGKPKKIPNRPQSAACGTISKFNATNSHYVTQQQHSNNKAQPADNTTLWTQPNYTQEVPSDHQKANQTWHPTYHTSYEHHFNRTDAEKALELQPPLDHIKSDDAATGTKGVFYWNSTAPAMTMYDSVFNQGRLCSGRRSVQERKCRNKDMNAHNINAEAPLVSTAQAKLVSKIRAASAPPRRPASAAP
eukprot:TRINITY_DN66615_c3_g2_i1.p1 TRINITY_DN66615_c3_g2~~TRINITY_DN66615_c3_g2_i1.p1  ORF type:complete len:507 (-),score=43.73 TRINITY_DN66615_c3_g2_i1:524-2044(-)